MGSDADVVLGVIQAVDERDGEKLFELYHEARLLRFPTAAWSRV
jgi:hypothetical protein